MTSLRFDAVAVRLGTTLAVRDVGLELGPGWTAIVGPNGAGKSTLLRAAAGLVPLAAGRIDLDGESLLALAPAARARRLAWLGQADEPAGELTAREIVGLGRLAQRGLFAALTADDDARVDAAMAETGCADWRHRTLAQLSGGERQRVLLARALAVDAPWLLLDEPTAHLDPPHTVALVALLRRLAACGRGVLSVLHDVSLALLAERIVVMDEGRVVAIGASGDAALHAAIATVFAGALRIEPHGGRWIALPHLP